MDPFEITMPDGSTKMVQPPPGFDRLSPEEQEEALAEFEQGMRVDWQVNRRAGEAQAQEDRLANPQTADERIAGFINNVRSYIPFSDNFRGPAILGGAAGDEFAHGYTLGATDHIAAAGTYFQPEMSGMPYDERLAVVRQEGEDKLAEADLGGASELALNMAGMVTNPVSAIGAGQKGWQAYKTAAATGGAIGGVEGFLSSDYESPEDLVIDTATGMVVGTVADLAGQGITDLVGGTLRVFAGSGNQPAEEVYQAFEDLGLRATADTMGGPPMRVIGNAAADTPFWSQASDVVNRGQSSAGIHREQIQGFEDQFAATANPHGANVDDVPSTFGPYAGNVADQTDARLADEVRSLEGSMDTVIDPNTPTPVPNTQAVPDRLRAAGGSTDVAVGPAEAQVGRITKDVAPRDVAGAQNRQWLDQATSELEQVSRQIDAITSSGAHRQDPEALKQLNLLSQTKKDLEMGIEMLQRNAGAMEGAPIRAVREVRSDLGQEIAGTQGVKAGEKKMLYGAMTDDLVETIRREGGDEAAEQFSQMMAREKEIFDNRALIKGMTGTDKASTNLGEVKRMVTSGNSNELKALTDGMPEEALNEFRAKTIYMLGDKDGVLNGTEFAKNWRKAGAGGREMLVPDPEQRALMDSLATVAQSLQERGKFGNHSNTSKFEEVFRLVRSAGAGSAVVSSGAVAGIPGVIGALAGVAGVDRAIASEALAKAMAGRPTELSKILEQVILAGAVQGDIVEVERNE